MIVTYTLWQKSQNKFTIAIQNETYYGVVRNYEIANHVPGKKYKGGKFQPLNPPIITHFGEYQLLCDLLQEFVIRNLDRIAEIKSSDHYIFKELDFN